MEDALEFIKLMMKTMYCETDSLRIWKDENNVYIYHIIDIESDINLTQVLNNRNIIRTLYVKKSYDNPKNLAIEIEYQFPLHTK